MQFLNQTPYFGNNTQAILTQRKHARDYYPDRGACLVSRRSRWDDGCWIFDSTTPGARPTHDKIVWDAPLSDGRNLLEPEYSNLLEELRRFVWGCFIDPRNSRALSPGSLSLFGYGMRELATWMVDNNYLRLNELDQRASERYLDAIQEKLLLRLQNNELLDSDITIENNNDEEDCFYQENGIHPSLIVHLLTPWARLWKQRSALRDAGVEPPRMGVPFGGKTVSKLAHEMASRIGGSIPAIPDDLACDIMNAAQRYMDVASDDLVKFSSLIAEYRNRVYSRHPNWKARPLLVEFMQSLEFSVLKDSSVPWHISLGRYKQTQRQFKKLVNDLIGAASIIIQSETGMRISEVMSLAAGVDAETNLPLCIKTRFSRSGMLELFYVDGKTSKM